MTVTQATPAITWAAPASIVLGTVLSSRELNATSSTPGTFTYSPAAGTVLTAGTKLLTVLFSPTDRQNYTFALKQVSLTVTSVPVAAPVINWASPASIVYGVALSSSQLNATSSASGTFIYSPAAGKILPVGTNQLSATFTPTDSTKYSSATKTVNQTVTQATPVINWATPASIVSGTALSSSQLNATSSAAGSFVYSPAAGTVPSEGATQLSVTFKPTDSQNYASATKTVSLAVTAASASTPTITWAKPASIVYGTALSLGQLNATSSAPGTFTYKPAPGTVLTAGTMQLSATFTPTDSTKYSSATKTVNLTVTQATPAVTWATPAPIVSGTALSSSQLNATSSVPGSFVYSPAAGTKLSAAGSVGLTAVFTPTDSKNYVSVTTAVNETVNSNSNDATPSKPDGSVTDIAIGNTAIQTGLKRLGMNISGQDYYDSGQMLKNLTFRNPGFEGQISQFILQCVAGTSTSCVDGNQYTVWPVNYLKGATFEFIYGAAIGSTGVVTSSTQASGSNGITMSFNALSKAPAKGDVVIVKMATPGNAQQGWWTTTQGGATLTTEFQDLAPNSPGKQALRVTAANSGQSANVTSYFDSVSGRSFLQLKGAFHVSFRAKGVGGNNQVNVVVERLATAAGNELFANQTISLTTAWKDYSFDFAAQEDGSQIGPVELAFSFAGTNALLDDVTLTTAAVNPANPTPFRDEVVSTLKDLHPGVLRYMDSGLNFGSSIDNMIAVPFARQRTNHSTQVTDQEDVPLGLAEFLRLCQTVGAEPWYSMPAAMSPAEMQHLIEYLGGSASTPYGAIRAALGQSAPWTSVFPVIHLELGNELWNGRSFYGATIADPIAYGNRTSTIFGAARSSASYSPGNFDLVMGSWASVPWWTSTQMQNSSDYDTVAVAPYLFNSLNDTSSNEAIFGSMFAQPEMVDSVSTGYMNQQAKAAAGSDGGKPAQLAVYEVGLSTVSGSASQSQINSIVPSVGAGLTVVEHMLIMMRDLGIKMQAEFTLPGLFNPFGSNETTPLWGSVIDMGGPTNLKRPNFLAQQLANTAILPTMLATTVTGKNPTWNQALSTNDDIVLNGAHFLQSFAFSEGTTRTLIVVNLSRTDALPITISGASAPSGTVNVGTYTSANLTDTNEVKNTVGLTSSTLSNFKAGQVYSTPPFSMTVLSWQASQ
ncbi:MAG: hypothetical protein ABI197_06825 [Granulicella sp.]